MKIALHLEQWPLIELEGSPEECALFVKNLKPGPSKPSPKETSGIVQGEAPTNISSVTGNENASIKKPAPTNRRQGILAVMEMLWQIGDTSPRLNHIIDRYQSEYPAESIENLDQVIRDLANKTPWVDSPARGRYRLVKDEN